MESESIEESALRRLLPSFKVRRRRRRKGSSDDPHTSTVLPRIRGTSASFGKISTKRRGNSYCGTCLHLETPLLAARVVIAAVAFANTIHPRLHSLHSSR